MRQFFKKNMKILFVCFFVLLTCTACSSPRGKDGKTKVDEIIASEQVEVKKSDVNTTDISDEKLIKEYKKLGKNDMITIEPTTFSDAFGDGWFDGLIVWPIATLINKVSAATDAGIGIIVATVLIQLIVLAITGKSQMSSQRMQEVQPEIEAIQNKYKGKTDDASRMKMYQETQAIYSKYDIHPFGTMLVTFIQLPIMMGMYYATMRAYSVIDGSFLGMSLSQTPLEAFKAFNIGIIIIYILMIVGQLGSLKLPQWLKKHQDKVDGVKKKNYGKQQQSTTQSTMNMYMYMMTLMFAFIYLSWPAAMAFYWFVTSAFRMIQSVVLHKVMNKKK